MMGLGKQATSQIAGWGGGVFLPLSLCHLTSPRLSVLNDLGSYAVLSCTVRSWREMVSASRLSLFDSCSSLHNSRYGVRKNLFRKRESRWRTAAHLEEQSYWQEQRAQTEGWCLLTFPKTWKIAVCYAFWLLVWPMYPIYYSDFLFLL